MMRFDAVFYTKGQDARSGHPFRFAEERHLTADGVVERCEAFFDNGRWVDLYGETERLQQERRVEVYTLMPTGLTQWPEEWEPHDDDDSPFWRMSFVLQFVEGEEHCYSPLYLPNQKSKVRHHALLIVDGRFERDIHPRDCVWCEGYGGIVDDDVGLRWGCDACRGSGQQDGWRTMLPGYVEPTEPDGEIPF